MLTKATEGNDSFRSKNTKTKEVIMSKNIEIAKLATMSKTVAAEDDKTLHKYYVETGKLQDVCSGGQVVLGTKGSGKTALFMHAHDSLKKLGVVVVPFSLVNDFPLERQKMFKDENVSLVERYVGSVIGCKQFFV